MTPSSSPVKLVLCGLGRWGVHLLRNFLALPQAEVVGVVDTSPQRLAQIRAQFALPDAVRCYDHWPAALAIPGLEAVVVATPASTHYPMIKAALEQGLHVLSEKPMTLDPATSEELCGLAIAQNRQLMVDHTYLFHPVVQAGYDLCQQGSLGELRYAYATRTNLGPVRPDADALWDLAIHDIAILNHWLGQSPTQVLAWGNVWLQPAPQEQFPHGLRDVGWVRLIYPNAVEATIHVSWLNPDKQRRLGLVGDRGTLVFDEMHPTAPLTLYPGQLMPQGVYFQPEVAPPQPILVPQAEPLAQMCRHFLDTVQQQQPSAIASGQQAAGLVRVMAAIAQSADTQAVVSLTTSEPTSTENSPSR